MKRVWREARAWLATVFLDWAMTVDTDETMRVARGLVALEAGVRPEDIVAVYATRLGTAPRQRKERAA